MFCSSLNTFGGGLPSTAPITSQTNSPSTASNPFNCTVVPPPAGPSFDEKVECDITLDLGPAVAVTLPAQEPFTSSTSCRLTHEVKDFSKKLLDLSSSTSWSVALLTPAQNVFGVDLSSVPPGVSIFSVKVYSELPEWGKITPARRQKEIDELTRNIERLSRREAALGLMIEREHVKEIELVNNVLAQLDDLAIQKQELTESLKEIPPLQSRVPRTKIVIEGCSSVVTKESQTTPLTLSYLCPSRGWSARYQGILTEGEASLIFNVQAVFQNMTHVDWSGAPVSFSTSGYPPDSSILSDSVLTSAVNHTLLLAEDGPRTIKHGGCGMAILNSQTIQLKGEIVQGMGMTEGLGRGHVIRYVPIRNNTHFKFPKGDAVVVDNIGKVLYKTTLSIEIDESVSLLCDFLSDVTVEIQEDSQKVSSVMYEVDATVTIINGRSENLSVFVVESNPASEGGVLLFPTDTTKGATITQKSIQQGILIGPAKKNVPGRGVYKRKARVTESFLQMRKRLGNQFLENDDAFTRIQTSAFGSSSTSSSFGSSSASSSFGSNTSSFGSSPTSSLVGSSSTSSASLTLPESSSSTTSSTSFGSQSTGSAFGSTQTGSTGFGGNAPPPFVSAFGNASTGSAFGNASTGSAFGSTQTGSTGFGGFGTSPFPDETNSFDISGPPQPNSMNSQPQQHQQQPSSFGGFPQPQQATVFGVPQPHQQQAQQYQQYQQQQQQQPNCFSGPQPQPQPQPQQQLDAALGEFLKKPRQRRRGSGEQGRR